MTAESTYDIERFLPEGYEPSDTLKDPGLVSPVMPDATGLHALESAVSMGRVLGVGGMAVVREAEQRVLQRMVAVKSQKKSDSAGDALVLEARIAGALEHPGILPIHDIVRDEDGRLHILMQRVDGTPWSTLMRDGETVSSTFGETDLQTWNLRVLEAVCNAVHFAHSHDVVHRDLKPDNVMVGAYGQVYVVDWGIAVSLRDDDPRFPAASGQRRIVGTPRYMAPEMVRGDGRAVSACTDVYLLGAILYEILAGRPPHRGLSVREILEGIGSFEPVFEPMTELGQLVVDAMKREPDARVPSAEGFRRRLRDAITHQGAARLAETARAHGESLVEALQAGTVDRVALYNRFGAVRFGFEEALRAWPESTTARDGLTRVTLSMAYWELEQGDDRAAEVLAGGLPANDPVLAARIAEVAAERLRREAEAEALRRDADIGIGIGARRTLAIALTIGWFITPFLAATAGATVRFGISVFWMVFVGVVFVVWRSAWMATPFNRNVAALLMSCLLGQLLAYMGVPLGALELHVALRTHFCLVAMSLVAASLIVDRRFGLPALLFVLAFLTSGWLEPYRPIVVGFASASVGAVGTWVWWPKLKDP